MTKPAERLLYGMAREDGAIPFWRMATIWAAAVGKPSLAVPIGNLKILDDVVWYGGPNNVAPTIRSVAEHARDIFSADMSYPIIMTSSGEVLDGAHRIARAYLEDQHSIAAVVIDDWPSPDGSVQTPMTSGGKAP